jgi:hypothetical protein
VPLSCGLASRHGTDASSTEASVPLSVHLISHNGPGMRSETSMSRRLTGAAAIEREQGRAFPLVNAYVLGLPGLEPGTSSLSGIEG